MKRILIVLASIAAFVLPMLALAPGAQAQAATGVVTNGMAWTANPSAGPPGVVVPYCTLGVVGTDSSGNKIAISARHCVQDVFNAPDGADVYRYLPTGTGGKIGTIAYRSANSPVSAHGTDWVVIKLNADADLFSNGPGIRIDGVNTSTPALGQVLCKDGVTTGVKCGAIYNVTPGRIYSFAIASGGDSGGPAYIDTAYGKIAGMVRGPGEFIRFSAVLSEINGQANPVGKGFVATNN